VTNLEKDNSKILHGSSDAEMDKLPSLKSYLKGQKTNKITITDILNSN
jgi:hypothetical protein